MSKGIVNNSSNTGSGNAGVNGLSMNNGRPNTITSSSTSSMEQGLDRFFNDYHFSAYMAMETEITITPRFSMDRVACIGGSYGPFEPNRPIAIPLWLALHMRQTDLCVFTLPHELRVSSLQTTLTREQEAETSFEPLPFYFYEIAKLITDACQDKDDIPHMAEVLRLINDIRDTRQRKLMRSMAIFEAEGSPMYIPGIKLTNIVSSEIHYLRSSFAKVLEQAYTMDRQRLLQRTSTDRIGVVPVISPLHSQSTITTATTTTMTNSNNVNNPNRIPSSMSSLNFTNESLLSHSHTHYDSMSMSHTTSAPSESMSHLHETEQRGANADNTSSQTTGTLSSNMDGSVLHLHEQTSRPTQMNWAESSVGESQAWSSQTSHTLPDSLSTSTTHTSTTNDLLDTPQRENTYSLNSYATSVTDSTDAPLAPPIKKRRTLRHP